MPKAKHLTWEEAAAPTLVGATAYRMLMSWPPHTVQPNDVVLHSDTSLMPRRRRAWACWNAYVPEHPTGRVALTYDMNMCFAIRCRF